MRISTPKCYSMRSKKLVMILGGLPTRVRLCGFAWSFNLLTSYGFMGNFVALVRLKCTCIHASCQYDLMIELLE